jgi:uncharacterized damage-inducible protein DinB
VPRSLLEDSFAHHAWATSRILDVCSQLDAGLLEAEIPGTVGTIMATARHLVSGDRFQLWAAGAPVRLFESDEMDFEALRAKHAENVAAWMDFAATHHDPDESVVDVDDAGWRRTATVGQRVAQALSHAVEHRTQICSAIATLGMEPPDVSGWQWGAETGLATEVPPQAPPA